MSEAAAAPDPPSPPLVVDRLADFSDKLSPMLVKELRQGLRAKTFVIVFLTLQGLLLLVLLSAVAASSQPQRAGGAISGIIFMFFSMALLVIQPIRGIGTLHREVLGKTIELMVLTRLSAWKIVLGKWVSIVSQSALIFAAIIPYLILRYWFGDMNLFGELSLMILVFLGSAVLTAVIVGISCVPSVILRGLVPLLAGGLGLFAIPTLCFGREFDELVSIASMQTAQDFWGVSISVLCAIYIGWTALGIGAGMIAPAAENHATLKRSITLVLLLLLLPVGAFSSVNPEALAALVAVILVPSIVLALSEPFMLLPPICTPFVRRGLPGRLAGRLLYPGWPSGVLFTVTAVALATGVILLSLDHRSIDDEMVVVLLGLLGSLLMPAALASLFEKKVKSRFTTFMLIFAAGSVVAFVLGFITDAVDSGARGFMWLFVWLPQALIAMVAFPRDFDDETLMFAGAGIALVYLLLLLVVALRRFREMPGIESEALDLK
ncbi:hypothetical protein [Haloferula sp. A504]|uniref:hypothetical protein n=1 Tax=Haloferula sp. A504 TaxID=3373601 RepID=UPI0031BD7BC2|nr:hypothetical protein [Verrucomicrobiaceae bacterium E54]